MATTTRHRGPLRAIWAGISDLVVRRDDLHPTTHRLEGQTILVTGASRGLGLAVTSQLAARGAHVIMACRSRQEEAPNEIRGQVPDARLDVIGVDLAYPEQVTALVQTIAATHGPLDAVVCNAGVVAINKRSPLGLDLMVHVNWLANVQLIEGLRTQGLVKPGGRLVFVGSEAHRSAEPLPLDRLTEPISYGVGETLTWYGGSKLLLHAWVGELARRLETVSVHHLCPGAIDSDIAREAPGFLRALVKPLMRLSFQSPATAAVPVVYLATAAEIAEEHSIYLHLRARKSPSETAADPAFGRRVYETGLALLETLPPREDHEDVR